MKNKIICFLLLISFSTFGVFAQQNGVKFQFGVFGENGNFFNALKASDIQIVQDKKSLQVASVELKTADALEIVIMIDASVSQERTLPDEKRAAAYFINDILKKGKDKVAIVKFTNTFSFVQDLTDDLAKAQSELKKIEFEAPKGYIGGGIVVGGPPGKIPPADLAGSTSLWDSVKQISEAFVQIKTNNARRAIILITDGVNTFGETKLKEAIEASIKTQIPVYAIGIGDEYYGGVDKKTLKKLTEQTGGLVILAKEKLADLPVQAKIFEQGLRSVYEVTFSPGPTNSKNLQEIDLQIINPELRKQKLQIVQPKGFFPPN
jgi:VWFA-related protein